MRQVVATAAQYRQAVARGGDLGAALSQVLATPAPPATTTPAPRERRHVEDDLQRAVADFLFRALPDDQPALWFHVPNGGARGACEAARLAGLGVRPGIPDIPIALPDGRMLWLELKAPGTGRVSNHQARVHTRLRALGHTVLVVTTVEEVDRALIERGVALRCRLT